ncbi:MAG: DotA/TraY family protein [Micavibrio aeruginosavorus]|nr:DotA/TraY family protein [Micavibrio aeruginosavorus]
MEVTARKILGYTLLPGIVPRSRALVSEGFGFIPYAMACVFETTNLLPRRHPYTNPVNIGKFGLRHVLAQAALNLRFQLRHLDQIMIYGLMLIGIVLLLVQFAAIGFSGFVQVAHAFTPSNPGTLQPLPTSFPGYFLSPNPTEDISFMVLDRLFGVPDMFNSCVAQNIPCIKATNPSDGIFPSAFHLAFREALSFYSYGLLIVAAIILAYYVVTIASEMALSGTPFGKRFSHIWAPLRLILAFGLLVPMNHNLNAAQYITLYAAKWGSGLGTNGWNFFLGAITTDTLMGSPDRLISKPQYPKATDILQLMSTAMTCKEAYRVMYNLPIDAYFVRKDGAPMIGSSGTISPYNERMNDLISALAAGPVYYDMQRWSNLGDLSIVFGHYDDTKPDQYKEYRGRVRPYCGEVTLESKRVMDPAGATFYDGADELAYGYLIYFVWVPWSGSGGVGTITFQDIAERISRRTLPLQKDMTVTEPTKTDIQALLDWFNSTAMHALVDTAYTSMITKTDWTNDAIIYGWAGAAIWFNKIAEANGVFTDAVFNLPRVVKYPELQEFVQAEKSKVDGLVTGETRFEPASRVGQEISELRLMNDRDKAILMALNKTYALWLEDPGTKPVEQKNTLADAINALMRHTGIWNFRDNENVSPLAALTGLGRTMLINSIVSFGSGSALGVFGMLSGTGLAGKVMDALSGFVITVAFIGLSVGILLYYVVPFLPFIYFFFAIVAWAKTIVEAMVGIPLWALAHLRYDGEGFPTRQSLYGYFLLLDIFLRPILCVFGLIGSIIVFYAMARTLNGIFDLVISNLSGFNMETAIKSPVPPDTVGSLEYARDAADKLFFTIIYAIIVYMIGMSSFKMIDQVPNNILRWMGGGVRSFGDMTQGDHGEEVAGNVMTGARTTGGQMQEIANMPTRGKIFTE